MQKKIEFVPSEKVCSKKMIVQVEDDKITNVEIVGGCPGNTKGICKLCEGRNIDEVISLLKGIPCGMRGTSCPDQLAHALEKVKEKEGTLV